MQELLRKDVPSTWVGAALWDRGWPAGERITESKGPVEAKKDNVAGIDACNKQAKPGHIRTSQKVAPSMREQPRTC